MKIAARSSAGRARVDSVPWLLAILALAFGARLAAALQLENSWYGAFLSPDEATYHRWAADLVEGRPHAIYSLSSLPAYVLAALYRFTGPAPVCARVLGVGLGVALCAVMYGIGLELAGRSVGLLSALMVAVYRPFVFFSGTLLKEPLALLLFAVLVLLFLRAYRRPGPTTALLLGATAGLLLDVRQNAGVVGVLLAAYLVRRAWARSPREAIARVAAPLLAGALVVCTPAALANLRGTGRASPMPLGGFDLYLGNNPDGRRPYWSPVPFTTTQPDGQGIEFMLEARRRTGRPLSLADASDYWVGEVARLARLHPARFLRRLGEKAIAAVSMHEEADNQDLDFARQFVGVLRLPLITYAITMPLGIAGLLLAMRRSRRAAALAAAALAYGATMVLVFPNMRIRAPLLVLLVPFAFLGLQGAVRRSVRARVGYVVLVALLVGVEAIPVPNTPDLTAQHNFHAVSRLVDGDEAGAEREWALSASLGGTYSDAARAARASFLLHMGRDPALARALLEAIPDTSVSAAVKYANLGVWFKKQGLLHDAAAAYERSLSINAGDPQPRRALIAIYEVIAPERVPEARLALSKVLDAWGPLAPPVPPDL